MGRIEYEFVFLNKNVNTILIKMYNFFFNSGVFTWLNINNKWYFKQNIFDFWVFNVQTEF